jgi:hypothetical protein
MKKVTENEIWWAVTRLPQRTAGWLVPTPYMDSTAGSAGASCYAFNSHVERTAAALTRQQMMRLLLGEGDLVDRRVLDRVPN